MLRHFAVFSEKYRKILTAIFLCVLLAYIFYNGPLLKILHAEPGNSREAYSIVMQTLGRTYVSGGEITEEGVAGNPSGDG